MAAKKKAVKIENNTENVQTTNEPNTQTLEQVQLTEKINRLRNFLKEENMILLPKMVYAREGAFPDIEIKIREDKVKNIYDEEETNA